MAKKKHGGSHEEHIDEGWLIPYADLLTLLLALFIVLFAVSSVDSNKYSAMMQAMYQAFTGVMPEAVEPPPGSVGPGEGPGVNPEDYVPPVIRTPSPSETPSPQDIIEGIANAQIDRLYNSLFEYAVANNMGSEISIRREEGGVLITLTTEVWFVSGSAQLYDDMLEMANKMAKLIEDNQSDEYILNVVVDGHTDNLPIKTAQYPSNLKLSLDRACNFLSALLTDSSMDPARFSVRGFGEYRPIASNDTPEGRARNRRVELNISSPLLLNASDDNKDEPAAPEPSQTPPAATPPFSAIEDPMGGAVTGGQ